MKNETRQLVCADLFKDQRVLVLGLGKTGLSCVRFLAERNVDFSVMDSRNIPPGLDVLKRNYSAVEYFVGRFNLDVVKNYDVCLVSPGISLKEPIVVKAVEQTKIVCGDIDVFSQCSDKPVIAITGSNGKSTVTALLGEMARQAKLNVVVAGNIGTPVLDFLVDDAQHDLYVLELSSFQLETTHNLNPAVSTILNISEDHMDRYDSIHEYHQAKQRIYRGNGAIVVNKDEDFPELAEGRQIINFTLTKPRNHHDFGLLNDGGQLWIAKGQTKLIPASMLKIKGRHNIANTLAALALGECVNIPMAAMLASVQTFSGLPHRTQWIFEHAGVQWFNDSKATNVGATIAAIKGLESERIIVILGGQGKGQDFTPLQQALESFCKAVFIYGEDAELIKNTVSSGINISIVSDLAEAVKQSHQLSIAGDIILLSPACASFDMFSGYEHRGEEFIRLTHEVVT